MKVVTLGRKSRIANCKPIHYAAITEGPHGSYRISFADPWPPAVPLPKAPTPASRAGLFHASGPASELAPYRMKKPPGIRRGASWVVQDSNR